MIEARRLNGIMAKFKVGDEVIDPVSGRDGTIIKVEEPLFACMGAQYLVVLSNGIKSTFIEDSLQPKFDTDDVFALCENRNFANYDDYMIVNTLFKIDNVNNSTISTLRASRTQFKAYQFKPLLKFFASPERRILIADEVGLGKTIETGHILLELKARKEFHNALIVCPKSLREKWKSEMSLRFGIDFTIYGGEDNDGNKYPSRADLCDRYRSGQDVRAIVNYEQIRDRKPKKDDEGELRRKPSLVEFLRDNKIRQSVVICDESHRLRNESTQSYRGAETLLEQSNAVIFLTATPVMIKEENLYNQMHLLCPEKYSNKLVFKNRMAQGRPFVLALSALSAGRGLEQTWQDLCDSEIVRDVSNSEDFPDFRKESVALAFSDDPIYKRIKDLFHSPDTPKTRVELKRNLMKMSAIQNEYTRTTKKQVMVEVGKVNERFPCTIRVWLNPDEQKESDRIINEHDNGLGRVQIQRMVASSVYGRCNRLENLEMGLDEYADRFDAKVDKLLKYILRPSDSNNHREIRKVIVFAVFINTLRYLKIRLAKKGIKCALIDGGVSDRQEVIDRFRADDEIRVLLSSEVGSEGLDMQFCDTIVNYDLPWNPMVVEQRIGRIDRIGQNSENIYIYNFVIAGSIVEDIYARLEKRIDIFKGTVGDLEPILNAPYKEGQSILEAHNNVELRYYKQEITKEQALLEEERISQAIEEQRKTIEEFSGAMGNNAISVDSYYDEQINIIQKRKSYVTDIELRNLLQRVLESDGTGCSQCVLERSREDARIWRLKIPQNYDDRECLENFLRRNRPTDSDSLKAYDAFVKDIHGKNELAITFDQSAANENHRIAFVNNYSPLVLACNEFRKKSDIRINKAFRFELHPQPGDGGVLKSGDRYLLLTYRLVLEGVSMSNADSIKELCPILFDIAREEIVSDEEVVSEVCSLAQDLGRDTPSPMAEDCSPALVSKFKALATQTITEMVKERKREIDEQNNAERERWVKEYREFYDGKIEYYQKEIKSRERDLNWQMKCGERGIGGVFGDSDPTQLKKEISGYGGTITRLTKERDAKLAMLADKSDVSITHEEVSVCYIVIR